MLAVLAIYFFHLVSQICSHHECLCYQYMSGCDPYMVTSMEYLSNFG